MWKLELFVAGVPVQQGSKNHVGGGRMIDSAKGLKPWRQLVALAAQQEMKRAGLPTLPAKIEVTVEATFVFKRLSATPKRVTGRTPMVVYPDIDKLLRAILDALTGVCYPDDGQVTCTIVHKVRAAEGEMLGVELAVYRKDEE